MKSPINTCEIRKMSENECLPAAGTYYDEWFGWQYDITQLLNKNEFFYMKREALTTYK